MGSNRPGWLVACLAGVFLLALAVRLTYMWQTAGGPLFHVNQGDARWHDEWARRIASGTLTDGRPFFRAPLYPFFLAGVYRIAGDGPWAARVVQHVLGAASCVLLFLLARRVFSMPVALIASLLTALYGPLMYFENELLMEPLAAFLMLAALLSLTRAADAPTGGRWLMAGLLLGLCCITRPNFLLVVLVVLAWLAFTGRRALSWGSRASGALSLLAGTALPIVPVTLHNVLVGGDFVLIASQGGINFEIGNNPASDGKTAAAPAWLIRHPHHGYLDNVYAASRLVAENDLGRPLKDSQVARYWLGRGLAFWREQPAAAATLLLKKLYFLFNGLEIESNRSLYLDRQWSPLFAALVWVRGLAFPFGLVGPLAVAGLLMGGGDRRLAGLLRVLAAAYALSVVIFFVNGRFRVPLAPLACLFAAHGAHRVALHLARRRWGMLSLRLPALAGLVLLCNTNWFGVRAVDEARQSWVVGSALAELGRMDEAMHRFQEALRREPDNPVTLADLGSLLLRRAKAGDAALAASRFGRAVQVAPDYVPAWLGLGMCHLADPASPDEDAARRCFDTALRLAPDHPPALVYLGEWHLRRNELAKATELLQRAVRSDPRYAAARVTLARAYEAAGRIAQAMRECEEAVRLSPNEAYPHYRLGSLLLDAGDVPAAMAHLREATRLNPNLARAWYVLGNALLARGTPRDQEEALSCFRRAVERQPDLADAHNNLAALLAGRGELDDAIAHLRRALEIAPADPEVGTNLAALLRRQGRRAEAIRVLQDGLSRIPDNADLMLELAWELATASADELRDGARAVELAESVVRKSSAGDARVLDVLAAALAEAGRFEQAAATAQRAAALAAARGQQSLSGQIASRAALYQAGHTYRQ